MKKTQIKLGPAVKELNANEKPKIGEIVFGRCSVNTVIRIIQFDKSMFEKKG